MGDKQISWLFPHIKKFKEKKNLYVSIAIFVGIVAWFSGRSMGFSAESQLGGFLCVTLVLFVGAIILVYYNPIRELEE